jgi:Holliday junction resolvase RusA-like endonuclease
MPVPFEFVIDGPPVSQQTRRRTRVREWTQEVKSVAQSRWNTESPFVGEVIVIITYFYEDASLDVDNIPKPILDALKGLVYSDDTEVSDLLCRKRDLNGDLRIQNPSSVLLDTLRNSEQQFLHITVDNAQNQEVTW